KDDRGHEWQETEGGQDQRRRNQPDQQHTRCCRSQNQNRKIQARSQFMKGRSVCSAVLGFPESHWTSIAERTNARRLMAERTMSIHPRRGCAVTAQLRTGGLRPHSKLGSRRGKGYPQRSGGSSTG